MFIFFFAVLQGVSTGPTITASQTKISSSVIGPAKIPSGGSNNNSTYIFFLLKNLFLKNRKK